MYRFNRVPSGSARAERTIVIRTDPGAPQTDIDVAAKRFAAERLDWILGTAAAAGIGASIGGYVGFMAGLGMITVPGFGSAIAAEWLVVTAAGLVAGSALGGTISALVGTKAFGRDGHAYPDVVRWRDKLAAVKATAPRDQIQPIRSRHSLIDTMPRCPEYEQAGWQPLDASKTAYQSRPTETARGRL